MTARDVKDILGARVLVGEDHLEVEVRSACGSDMMSDVLAFSKDHSVLLTGRCWILSVLFLSEGKSPMMPCWKWRGSET